MNPSANSKNTPFIGAELANLAIGIWIALSPFVLGFTRDAAAMWNNIAIGIALVLVTVLGQASGFGRAFGSVAIRLTICSRFFDFGVPGK